MCNADGECTPDLRPFCGDPPETALVVEACGNFAPDVEPYALDDVALQGDQLVLNVSYSGGCRPHTFVACHGDFAESAPIQVQLRIGHTRHRDRCRGHVTEALVMDLSPLLEAYAQAYPGGGAFDLVLPQWDEAISLR